MKSFKWKSDTIRFTLKKDYFENKKKKNYFDSILESISDEGKLLRKICNNLQERPVARNRVVAIERE